MADFEYYYGEDAEQFNFFRLPKRLIRDRKFHEISSEAKILYGVLLDRMALSVKNGWIDSENRVYIIYAIHDVEEEFNCSRRKAIMLLNELDTVHGIGLIEKKRQGLGKPNLIYVKNFNSIGYDEVSAQEEEAEHSAGTYQETPDQVGEPEQLAETNVWIQEGEVQTSQKCKNVHFQKCKDVHLQKCKDVHLQKCRNVHPNKTDNSETDSNNNLSIYPSGDFDYADKWMDRELVMGIFREKLGYDSLMLDYPHSKERIDELFSLLTDVCCYTGNMLPVGGKQIPVSDVRTRFMQQLTMEHIRYVVCCLEQNTTKVANIRAYLLTCLYNAPVTMHSFYHALVQHDQSG